jgi:hypothetical protein
MIANISRILDSTHGGWTIVRVALRAAVLVTAILYVGIVAIACIKTAELNASVIVTYLKIALAWTPAIFVCALVLASVGPVWIVAKLHWKLRPFGLGAWTFLALPMDERKRLVAELHLNGD